MLAISRSRSETRMSLSGRSETVASPKRRSAFLNFANREPDPSPGFAFSAIADAENPALEGENRPSAVEALSKTSRTLLPVYSQTGHLDNTVGMGSRVLTLCNG